MIPSVVYRTTILPTVCYGGGKRESCFDVAQHGISANVSVTFQATLNLSAYLINHCLAVLCKFLGDFLGILEKRYFFSKDRLN